ncbi:MAG: zinc-binding dehydrogenase [Clostridia bacterium]
MLKVENINVFYGGFEALRSVSFEVQPGEIVALLGANGAGKTTTINTISGLTELKTGEILFNDEKINGLPAYERVKRGVVQVPEGRKLFPTMTVLDFGAGPIGLLTAIIAKKAGASKIVITDINDYRIGLAKELDFDVIDGRSRDANKMFMEQFSVKGADISFELAANLNTLDLAINVTKIRGTVLAGGIFKKLPTVDLQKITLKEQQLIGTRLYTYTDFEAAIEFLCRDEFPVEKLITKRLGMTEVIEKGFEAIRDGEDVMKILLDPQE